MIQVLGDLPKKTERIEWCEMTPLQKKLYNGALRRSRKTVMDLTEEPSDSAETKPGKKAQKKGKTNARKEKQYVENSANVLMDLRKAASHPMLFRCLFTDETVSSIARVLLKEPDFKSRGAVFQYVREDLEVMTDSELQVYMASYKVRNHPSGFEAFRVLMLIPSRRKSSFRILSVTSGQEKLRHF